MSKELNIYHGSISIIKKPEFGKGNPYNDYGLGVYCTESIDLAKEWAVTETLDGYANKYTLDMSNLKLLDLSTKHFSTLNWITLLLQNRVFSLKNDIAKVGKDFLIKNFSIDISAYDVIKGYRADDSYFAYAESFLNNTITIKRLSEALKLGDLGEQIVLKSKKAFDSIKFQGYEIAEKEIYYPIRKERNEKARFAFLSNKRGLDLSGIYLSDLIKGDIDKNDPRLQ